MDIAYRLASELDRARERAKKSLTMNQILIIIQIIVSVLLILFILLQQRGTALGSAFGGEGGFYLKRRGIEKKIFWGTVILATLFIVLSLINLLV